VSASRSNRASRTAGGSARKAELHAPPSSHLTTVQPLALAKATRQHRLTGGRFGDHALIAACVAGIVFLLLQILTFGYGRDQGIYAMVARAITRGEMPYRDAWDFKPPGIFLLYALARALFGSRQIGIRIIECLSLAAMVVAMVRLTKQWWGDRRIGLLAGAIAILIHVQLDFWHTAQPESFGGVLTILALLLLGYELGPASNSDTPPPRPERNLWARGIAAGALFGAAGLLKPPLAGGGAVVAIVLAIRTFRANRTLVSTLRPIAAIALGGAIPIALCLLWFFAKGALFDLIDVLFVFTPHYTRLGWEGSSAAGMMYWGFTEWLVAYGSVPTVGLLLLLGFGPSRQERFGVLVIGAIILIHLIGVVMQGKFFPYHYGATWPLTALLAALGFFRLWERLAPLGVRGVLLFFLGFSAVALGRSATKNVELSFRERCAQRLNLFTHSPIDLGRLDQLASVADVNAAANRAVANLLREWVPSDRTIFIWGFEPVIYDLAERTPATRYLYNVPQRVEWAKGKARKVLIQDLEKYRPAAIVVEHRDVFPMVTGDAIDSAGTLDDFTEFRSLLDSRYWLARSIEDFDVYLEQPPATDVSRSGR
jgi:hypothetical protein